MFFFLLFFFFSNYFFTFCNDFLSRWHATQADGNTQRGPSLTCARSDQRSVGDELVQCQMLVLCVFPVIHVVIHSDLPTRKKKRASLPLYLIAVRLFP